MKWLLIRKWLTVTEVPLKYLCTNVAKNLKVGDRVVMRRTITLNDLRSFTELTQDLNPIHCANEVDARMIVHGAFLNGLVSAVMGTKLPGPGSVLVEQVLKFPNSCYVGETVEVEVEIVSVRKIVECKFDCCVGEKIVLRGTAKLVISKDFSQM